LDGDENKAAREAFRRDAWNKYRIEALGNTIKTRVNGAPAADLTDTMDTMDAAGFIALQVHQVGKKEQVGKQVRWRNIHIQEVTPK